MKSFLVTFQNVVRWGIYPLAMTLATVLFFQLQTSDGNFLLATILPVWACLALIIWAEWFIPFQSEWKPKWQDWKLDGTYVIFIQTILPQVLTWLSALFVLRWWSGLDLPIHQWWPHHWSIGWQEISVILISDLLRYGLHRLSHTWTPLWKLHAVHHSVLKMYWLNTARFHPVEKSLQFLMDVLPFMLLGISEEVIALHLVLYGVNGFFQHCNADVRFGWLNYIVSSTELHRWHHSQHAKESNNNYGNNVIVWDLLFGTFYWPKDRSVKELGLHNPTYPQRFWGQMKAPVQQDIDVT